MKKVISLILILAMALSGFSIAFATTANGNVPADVKGTIYENAVKALMEKGVITGYADGTFKPNDTISRAEACVVIALSMNPSEDDLSGAPASGFPDLSGFEWAAKYINYAVSKGVVNGYPDGTFRPDDNVTYNEMATMLVLALGYKATDLSGSWPANYVNKAVELGIFTGITFNGNDAATRGHVALMDYSVVDDITEANKPEDETGDETPSDDTDYEDLAGFLADYSGKAYGIILDTAAVMNDKGDAVNQIEFLIGDKVLYLNTDGKATLPSVSDIDDDHNDGILHGLRMSNGIVKGVGYSDNGFADISGNTNFVEYTSGWDEVIEDASNGVVEFDKDDTAAVVSDIKTILDDASIYVAVIENNVVTGYEKGSLSDIDDGSWIRLYHVTGNEPGIVEVVIVSEIKP